MAGRPKSTLAKAAGAEPSGQMRAEKSHSTVARSTFAHEKPKDIHVRGIFGSSDFEKVHAIVARSTCGSQHDMYKAHHFWTIFGSGDVGTLLEVGAEHVSKAKKHHVLGPF